MDLIKRLDTWKKDLEALGIAKGKAEGRREQALEALQKAGFDSVEDAQTEVSRLEGEKEKLEAQAKELLQDFEEKYAEFIE